MPQSPFLSLSDCLIGGIMALIGLSAPDVAQANSTSMTELASFDGGEIKVTYYRYVATDCPDEWACKFPAPPATGRATLVPSGRQSPAYNSAVAVISGFSLSTPHEDLYKQIAIRVTGVQGTKLGDVDVSVNGLIKSEGDQLFSYAVTFAVIESSVEGLRITPGSSACTTGMNGECPAEFTFPGAAPDGYTFVGFGMTSFDSDRGPNPFFGAVAFPQTFKTDPQSGDIVAVLNCGTLASQVPGKLQLTHPCETSWVAIAIPPGGRLGTPPLGMPIMSWAPWTVIDSSGVNGMNPVTTLPAVTCFPGRAKPTGSPGAMRMGFLDVLGGFFEFAGDVNGGAFTPALGLTSSFAMDLPSGFGFTPTGQPEVKYAIGLDAQQSISPSLPPIPAPLTFMRLSTFACL